MQARKHLMQCLATAAALLLSISPGAAGAAAPLPATFAISLDASSVGLGRVVKVSIDASAFAPSANGTVFWPFVNGSQWGSFVTCAVEGRSPGLDGGCAILLPLPFVGAAEITVAVLSQGRDWGGGINTTGGHFHSSTGDCDTARGCVYPVGTPFPTEAAEVLSHSAASSVSVLYRRISLPAGAAQPGGEQHDVCMDWEPWHTRINTNRWIGRPGASAMPMVGMYSSFHPGVIRQHAIWLTEAGITCIEIDWSNSLWSHQQWAARSSGAQELNNATVLALETYAEMRAEGHDAPKALFMIGLKNGPPATPSEVGKEGAFIQTLVSKLGVDRFVTLESKPLLLVLYCGSNQVPNASTTHAVNPTGSFTIRWLGTQMQETPQLALKDRFWSWMDGVIDPVPTLRPDGSAEALTVTPGFFAGGGWLAPQARAQERGATFTAEMATAVRYKPTVLLVCQWNEWAGQPDGKVGGFVDAYNLVRKTRPSFLEFFLCLSRACLGKMIVYISIYALLKNGVFRRALPTTWSRQRLLSVVATSTRMTRDSCRCATPAGASLTSTCWRRPCRHIATRSRRPQRRRRCSASRSRVHLRLLSRHHHWCARVCSACPGHRSAPPRSFI
jgi:hypothetical protein